MLGTAKHNNALNKFAFILAQKLALLAVLLSLAVRARALPRPGWVRFEASSDTFCLVNGAHHSPIYVDPQDFAGVERAGNDLALDIGRVSATASALVGTIDGIKSSPILIGTLGKRRHKDLCRRQMSSSR